jgi:magnesium chelatase family protein
MLYKTFSAAVYGIDASIIEVEVDVSGIKTNEDHFHTVGLPDAAVRESRDRVRSALRNCGYDIPPTHITVNLAPADIRKEGSGFDLPMALGILGAYGGLNKKELLDCVFVGELSLDGGVRGVRGTLPIAIETRGKKIGKLIVPEVNAREAAMVSGIEVYPVKSLLDVIHFVNTGNGVAPVKIDSDTLLGEAQHYPVDFKDVRGQQTAKRALEIACAGGHNILMMGMRGRWSPGWHMRCKLPRCCSMAMPMPPICSCDPGWAWTGCTYSVGFHPRKALPGSWSVPPSSVIEGDPFASKQHASN